MIVDTDHGSDLHIYSMPVGHCFYIPSLAMLGMRLSDHGRSPEAQSHTVRVLQVRGSHIHLIPRHTVAIYLGEPTLTMGPGRIPTLEDLD